MKEFLVDIPVEINIWIRKKCQEKQFEVIRQARPSILFLQSDGGRNEKEWGIIKQNRELYEKNIDWDCTVYKLYEDKNNGLYTMAKKTMEFVWSKVDRCIFLEDDIIPSISYFRFCAELLERYKNDYRISCISGLNYYGEYNKPKSDYFFSGEASVWGLAMWKRTYEQFNMDFSQDEYITNCILDNCRQMKKGYSKTIKGYINDAQYGGHVPFVEFFKQLLRFSQNQFVITPTKNMICCEGISAESVHSSDDIRKLPKDVQKVFFMKTHEIVFPLKHPGFVVRDIRYDRYVCSIIGGNSKINDFGKKVERFIRCVIFGDWKKIKEGLLNQFRKKIED